MAKRRKIHVVYRYDPVHGRLEPIHFKDKQTARMVARGLEREMTHTHRKYQLVGPRYEYFYGGTSRGGHPTVDEAQFLRVARRRMRMTRSRRSR